MKTNQQIVEDAYTKLKEQPINSKEDLEKLSITPEMQDFFKMVVDEIDLMKQEGVWEE